MIKYLLLSFLILSNVHADYFKIAGTFLDMDYVETANDGSFLDSENSDFNDIVGIELEYNMIVGNGFGGSDESALEFSLNYAKGDSKYVGSLQSTLSNTLIPFESTSEMTIIDPKIRWNETKKGSSYDVGVFVSFGYRYWERNLGSQYGYNEQYSWMYVDTGMKAIFHDDNWHIGFEVAYQRAISPKLHAELNGGLDFDLGTTDGFYYEIPLTYDINKNTSIELAYKYDNWNIEVSNIVGGYYEPQSETKNQKITIGLIIKW